MSINSLDGVWRHIFKIAELLMGWKTGSPRHGKLWQISSPCYNLRCFEMNIDFKWADLSVCTVGGGRGCGNGLGRLKLKLKVKVSHFFYSDSYRYTYLTRARFTSSDRYAGMTLGRIAAPHGDLWRVWTNQICPGCIRSVVHPSTLQPYEGLWTPSRSWY